jgi:hypothetical protein
VSLPATPPAISSIFFYTGSSGAITVRVPAGAVSAYTAAWGVDANTPAGGNTSTYGSNHKAVFITDAAPLTGLDGLADAPGGNTADNPVSLTLSGSLTNDSWAITLTVIAGAGKYVSLDLSACTMDETVFAPGTYAGANRITALVLPDAAKSIPAGDYSSPTFRAFTALASLSGAGVETIGDWAFYRHGFLTSVSLPAATSIGSAAFGYCTRLTSVSLPAVQTIANASGYYSNSNYYTVGVFSGCTSLASVNLPAAQTIGYEAFSGCTNLAAVSLPATPPSIDCMFEDTGYNSSGTITISVPAGVVFAYTSEWGVDVNTPANSYYNGDIYGSNHKAVLITDAAQ